MAFHLKTDVSQLSLPSGDATKKTFRTIHPTNAVSGSNFQAGKNVTFNFTVSGSDWYVPSESFMTIRYTLCANNGTKIVDSHSMCPAWNGVAGLFQTARYTLGDTLVSQSNDLALEDSLYKKMSQSGIYNYSIGSQYLLDEFVSRKESVKQHLEFETNYVPTCLSIFNQGSNIPGTVNHRFELSIANHWQQRFIHSTKTGGSSFTLSKTDGSLDAAKYHLSIDDISFHVCTLEGPRVQPAQSYFLDTRDLTSYTAAVKSTSIQHNFTIKPTCYRLTFANIDERSRSNLDGLSPPTTFAVHEYVDDNRLSNFRMVYAGQNYPELQEEFRLTGNQVRAAKVYSTTMKSWLSEDSSSGWYPVRDWLKEPIFSYSVTKPVDDRSTALEVFANYSAEPDNTQIVVFCESLSTIQLMYNEVGDLSSVIKMDR